MQQYVMHYQTIINHVRDGNLSFWDFNNGFGTNLFQLNLFDPTLDLLYLTGILTERSICCIIWYIFRFFA